ncbi:arsenic metallochaperone ArsD family protein [Erysipelothrix sp. HDW6C]|uniref:arsenic metallochaperone ArsD family protein n=1 Tax=Erysipelothrix sp. HDW6C TaxID=2714930 RepID=UPI0014080D89|nr:arsenic metallochaperone ArsD family protein [Erysipelothrix sp. HDW6C]QIK68902.1 arsenic metallochaperone ArsD family protein [Erysipelothrix sp. HDW6C]
MELTVYEVVEDLGSALLGIDTDPRRSAFKEMVKRLELSGIDVKRFNNLHDKTKTDAYSVLPTFVVDGKVVAEGNYPLADAVASWFSLDSDLFSGIQQGGSLFQAANSGRISACCGVGTDVYLDPNDDEIKE